MTEVEAPVVSRASVPVVIHEDAYRPRVAVPVVFPVDTEHPAHTVVKAEGKGQVDPELPVGRNPRA